MKEFIISKEESERTVLVGLITPEQNEQKANEYLDELSFLTETAGAEVVKRFTQKVPAANSVTYVGKGKLAEIKAYMDQEAENGREIGYGTHEELMASCPAYQKICISPMEEKPALLASSQIRVRASLSTPSCAISSFAEDGVCGGTGIVPGGGVGASPPTEPPGVGPGGKGGGVGCSARGHILFSLA